MDILASIAIGIGASYIASKIFNSVSKNNLPNIEVSNDIKIYKNGGKERLLFKLVNHTKYDLINIEIELFGIHNLDDKGVLRKRISLAKSNQAFIDKYDTYDDKYKYAMQYALSLDGIEKDIAKTLKEKSYDILMLFVKVENPYYGSIKATHKEYKIDEIKPNTWMFESGKKIICRKKD